MKLNVLDILLFTIALVATWGSGLQFITSFDLSKLFFWLSLLLISYWLIILKGRVIFSKYFNCFVIYVFLHTLVIYGIFFRNEFNFGYINVIAMDNGYIRLAESTGVQVARLFLFILFGYALAAACSTINKIKVFALGYGLGIILVLFWGGYSSYSANEFRVAGSFLDPNAFGFTGMTIFFISLAVSLYKYQRVIIKVFFYITSFLGGYIVFMSGSRAAVLSLIIGFLFLVYSLKNIKKKFKLIMLLSVLIITVLIFLNNSSLNTVQTRFNLAQIQDDRGSGRLDIWKDYLLQTFTFFFTGVGLLRSMEVIRTSYSYLLKMPHNNYLLVLVEFGFLGLLFFILGIKQLWFKLMASKNNFKPGFLGLLSAWCIMGLFFDSLSNRNTWIMFGIIAGYSKITEN